MEFIPNNASVAVVVQHISFALAKRINFHRDREPAGCISHTRDLSPQPEHTSLCHLMKYGHPVHINHVMYIQTHHKSFTSYFLLLLTSSEAFIRLSRQSDHCGRTWVKGQGTAVRNSRRNSSNAGEGGGLRGIRRFLGCFYRAAKTAFEVRGQHNVNTFPAILSLPRCCQRF